MANDTKREERERTMEYATFNRMTVHISIGMINVCVGVFGTSGVEKKQDRKDRTKAFDSLMAIRVQKPLTLACSCCYYVLYMNWSIDCEFILCQLAE